MIARIIVVVCLLWLLLVLPLLGGGSKGKDLLSSWAGNSFLKDHKGGVPILMLAVPILIAGTVASLFATTTTSTTTSSKARTACGSWMRPSRTTRGGRGRPGVASDRILPRLTVVFVMFPCLVYTLSSLYRHLHNGGMTTDTKWMEIANVFGMLAVIVLSWLLIPVTRSGPIQQLLQTNGAAVFRCCCYTWTWDPMTMVRQFHMWGGRIVVTAGVLHGTMHTIRYSFQGWTVFRSYLFPPFECWKHPQSYQPLICEEADIGHDGRNKCSCYDHFLPLTGWVAGLALFIIGVSSLYRVRRQRYALFALLHYTMAPLSMVAICVHYNKAVLYLSGGALYYMACNLPRLVEATLHRIPSPVKVVSVEKIDSDPSHRGRPCVSLTMEATETAMQRYRAGMYGRLLVPKISRIAHPFTVNKVFVEQTTSSQQSSPVHRFRIIFRATGPFTRALEASLTGDEKQFSSTPSQHVLPLPTIYLSGWYGSERLASEISSHDNVLIVAAGVGITPYLSLLADLNDAAKVDQSDDNDGLVLQGGDGTAKKISVHWICRDQSLVDYCRGQYLDRKSTKGDANKVNANLHITIHYTGGCGEETIVDTSPTSFPLSPLPGSSPFSTSTFVVGERLRDNLGNFGIFSAIAWGGLYLVWIFYNRQDSEAYAQRFATVIVVFLYAAAVSFVANLFCCAISKKYQGWSRVAVAEDDEEVNSIHEVINSIEPRLDREVEMSTYRDSLDDSFVNPGEGRDDELSGSMEPFIKTMHGRPAIGQLLEGLHVSNSPALFCCVPPCLEKELHQGVGSLSLCRRKAGFIPIYSESFEL